MVQFLISVIEWFAIFALNMFGIEYSPETNCETHEARVAEVVFLDDGFTAFSDNIISLQDCAVKATMMNYEDTPLLLQIPHRYDS